MPTNVPPGAAPAPQEPQSLLEEWKTELLEHGRWTSGHSIAERLAQALKFWHQTASQAMRDVEQLTADLAAVRAQLELQEHEAKTRWAENTALQIMQGRALKAEAALTALRAELAAVQLDLVFYRDVCNQRAAANDKLQTELAEVRARLALPPQDQTLEHELRKEWWLNHGYRCFPYGDDGEMQCCMHDFKREPLDQLRIFVDESRMARLKSAVEGRLALPAWQPIETAPKDGTEVLLFQERRIVAGSWNSGGAMHMPHWMGGNYKPTHWMLLPAPPSGDTLPAFVTHEPLPSFITREGHDGTAPAPDESDSHGL